MTSQTMRLGTAPGRFPTVSHAWNLLRRPLPFLRSLRDVGDIVRIRLGPEWGLLVQHPDLLHRMLVSDAAVYDKGGAVIDAARLVVGNGLGTCPYADHRRQRRLLQPAFHRDRLPGYAAVMRREIDAMATKWRPGEVLDVTAEMHTLMLTLLSRTLFFIDDAGVAPEVQRSIPLILRGLPRRMFIPIHLLWKLPLPGNRRFDRAFTRIRAMAARMVEACRSDDADHGDLLSMLLATRDEDTGGGMADGELVDQIITLLIGGIEAPSSTLSWAFHLLGEHPEVERRLHAEVDAVLDGRSGDLDDVPKLEYTRRVLTETLRLYPPSWLLTRRTTADTELGGHPIARGTNILFSAYLMHRDPNYFPDPERFDPDRWLPERARAVPRSAMLPFGNGARRCIGETFGMTADTLALATLAGRWRLQPVPGPPVRPVTDTTLHPGVLKMQVVPRRPDAVIA